MMKRMLALLMGVVLLAGCTPSGTPAQETAVLLPTETSTATPTVVPSATPTSVPTLTPTATPEPTATSTPAPTHPLMIEVMRQQSYPGSELVFEETLTAGSNYDRYRVSYRSEGLKIYALLTIPQGEKPENGWPVIIFNHGYIPPDQYRTTERYIAYTDAFSRNGYMLLRPDYRGHDQSEGVAVSSHVSPAYTIDVLNGMASVMRHPDADADNVGMWGHSMGGGITLRAMVITDTIKAGVIWAGTTVPYPVLIEHWAKRWADRPTPTPNPDDTDSDWDDELWRLDLYEENLALWTAIDPFSYLADISGPVQIHHGDADDSVPVEWSSILHESLLEAGQESELYIYPGNDHNIAQSFGTAMQRSVDFFDNHLKGEE